MGVPQDDEVSVRDRYAPMRRLLSRRDENYLRDQGRNALAAQLRREHRRCYFAYVTALAGEVRHGRRLMAAAMGSQQQWNFRLLLTRAVASEASLMYLRWLGMKHAAGMQAPTRDIAECLNFLLGGPKFELAAT